LPSIAPSFVGDLFNPTSPFLACKFFDGDDRGYTVTQSSPSTNLSGIGSYSGLLYVLIFLDSAYATSIFNGFDAIEMPTPRVSTFKSTACLKSVHLI
jgi:hypothetical protein